MKRRLIIAIIGVGSAYTLFATIVAGFALAILWVWTKSDLVDKILATDAIIGLAALLTLVSAYFWENG